MLDKPSNHHSTSRPLNLQEEKEAKNTRRDKCYLILCTESHKRLLLLELSV